MPPTGAGVTFRAPVIRLAASFLALVLWLCPVDGIAQSTVCAPDTFPGIAWRGADRHMPVSQLAAYLAPIFWFSPDEPLLGLTEGSEIRIPTAVPAEPRGTRPVVYFQLDRVLERGGESVAGPDTILDLARTYAVHLTYLLHFDMEAGLGAHPHDLEPVELRAVILTPEDVAGLDVSDCAPQPYTIFITRATGKAHGLVWFWNILETDAHTRFPIHVLVEEGKHALAPDKNGDGMFTPGFDANERVNDAWGVRDVISTGHLFEGGYRAGMSKLRRPEHRIVPPLPGDSRYRSLLARWTRGDTLATYDLRPFPGLAAAADDARLATIIKHQAQLGGTKRVTVNSFARLTHRMHEGAALHSLSVSYRGGHDPGVSFVFPFLIVRHVTDPLTGGYIVHRMYFKDTGLRDFGWMAMFAPSASRWLDTYYAGGVEWDASSNATETHFVFETGLKVRLNMRYSPLKFLGKLWPYWGVRAGIKLTGFDDVTSLNYVIEVGAGPF